MEELDKSEHVEMHISDEKRHKLIEDAFNHFTVSEFRLWGCDTVAELVQQISRLRTDKFCKKELIKKALMVEDAICMIWMMLKNDHELIEEVKGHIYSSFEKMLEEENIIKK